MPLVLDRRVLRLAHVHGIKLLFRAGFCRGAGVGVVEGSRRGK